MSAVEAAERLKEDVGQLLDAGRVAAREYGAAGATFRKLFLADLSLARIALIRGLVFLLLCALMAAPLYLYELVFFGAPSALWTICAVRS